MHKIGVLIPSRGKERSEFVKFCLEQMQRQTRKPDEILLFDEEPKSEKPDITYRYRKGCQELTNKGCNLIVFIENDDAYSRNYIETIYTSWLLHDKPAIIGINSTIYYNIFNQKFKVLHHNGRASMMSTAVTPAVNSVKWPDDNYSFTDLHLWKQLKGVSFTVDNPICVGIKHGTGMCGGGGHVTDWGHFDQEDSDFEKLSKWVETEALNFYKSLAMKEKYIYKKVNFNEWPFLSIITRRKEGKRGELFKNHTESIKKLKSFDFEQIFIVDPVGYGMLEANTSFQYVKDQIKGEWVYLLDDDDFLTDPNFVGILKENHEDVDVIFFKNKILTGDGDQIYPKPDSWESRVPKRGQIGGSCFAVRRWVYDKYIHYFAKPSFGDWYFITEVLKDENVKCKWVDKLMFETGRVSHGVD
jgi:hypothetical protein